MATPKDKVPGLVSKATAIAMLGEFKQAALKNQIKSQMDLLFQLLFGMSMLKDKGSCDTEANELMTEILQVLKIDKNDIVTLERSPDERQKVIDRIQQYRDGLQELGDHEFNVDENAIQQVELRANKIEKIWHKQFMGPLSVGELIVPDQLRAYLYGIDHAFSHVQSSRAHIDAIDPAFIGIDMTPEVTPKVDSWFSRTISNGISAGLSAVVVPAITASIDIDLGYMRQATKLLQALPPQKKSLTVDLSPVMDIDPVIMMDYKSPAQELVAARVRAIEIAVKEANAAFGVLVVSQSVDDKTSTTFIGCALENYADAAKLKTESLIFVSLLEMDKILQQKKASIVSPNGSDWAGKIAELHAVCEQCKRDKILSLPGDSQAMQKAYTENLAAAKAAIVAFTTLAVPTTDDEMTNRALWQIKAQADAIYNEKDKPSIIAVAVEYVDKHMLRDKPVVVPPDDKKALSWTVWGWSFVTAGVKAVIDYGAILFADNQVSAKLTDHLGFLISINLELTAEQARVARVKGEEQANAARTVEAAVKVRADVEKAEATAKVKVAQICLDNKRTSLLTSANDGLNSTEKLPEPSKTPSPKP